MGYLSLYKTLADYNKDASNRQNPHVSLITDDKKLILINSSNVSKEISNVKIIESLTPNVNYPDYNDFPTDTQTIMPTGIKIYTDNSQKSKETNKQLFDNYVDYLNIQPGYTTITVSVACVDDIIYNDVITWLSMDIANGELKVDEFYTISSDGSIVVIKNIHDGSTPAPENDTTTTSSEVPTTTTSDTTPTPGGTYFTEMPISVKLVDNDGNEVKDIVPVTFSIDCNGYSKSITLTSSGTLSGYHPLDNNGIESFFIDCDAEMHYKDGNEYYVMPEITSYGQFSNYYHKGGAIYIFVYSLVTPAPPSESTTPNSNE